MLSEHQCQGWLEGYLLTGRHGFFSCYEAFIHIINSMFNQHAKWLKVLQSHSLAAAHRLAELSAVEPRLAAGPQWLQPSGSWVHRPCRQQEGRGRPRLSAARRQLPAVGHRPLPAQPELRQCRRRRQATGAAMADDGAGDQALRGRARHLGVGQQRPWRRARRRDGLLRRRADAGDPRCRRPASPARSGAEDSRHQRRRPDEAAAVERAPARPLGRDFDALFTTDKPIIFAFHGYPWLIHRLTYRRNGIQHPCARLQGRGHHHDAVRHVRVERPRSLPSGERRNRPRAEARGAGGLRQAGNSRQAYRPQGVYCRYGDDMPEITGWRWGQEAASAGVRSTEADNV